MARVSTGHTIRIDNDTLNDVKELGERFGLSVALVVSNAIRVLKAKCDHDKGFTLLPRKGTGKACK